jgi:hypothetical protein
VREQRFEAHVLLRERNTYCINENIHESDITIAIDIVLIMRGSLDLMEDQSLVYVYESLALLYDSPRFLK